jgi:hypothetical protein
VIDENDVESLKHDDPRSPTDPGITIDFSDESDNADDIIHVNLESDSHERDENAEHW